MYIFCQLSGCYDRVLQQSAEKSIDPDCLMDYRGHECIVLSATGVPVALRFPLPCTEQTFGLGRQHYLVLQYYW
jgi:hypothetical protein